jgi:hypothetical protein
MNFNFDTTSLNRTEAQAVIALLNTLFPVSGQVQLQPVSQPSMPRTEEQAIFGVPVETARAAAMPKPELPASEPAQITTRRRRTKAEMAADALLQQSGHLPAVPTSAVAPGVGPQATAESVKTTDAKSSDGKAISADEFRSLLNNFIQKHTMEDAIAKLREFGCSRVTEALNLEAGKLHELAVALNA